MTRWGDLGRAFALVAAVGVLGACTATPIPTPSVVATGSAPTASPSPTPTPSPVARSIVVDSQGIAIVSTTGTVLERFTYFDPIDVVVAALTPLLGAEPAVAHQQPYEGYPYTGYTWPGFGLSDSDQESDGVYYVNFRVSVSAPSLNGITLETVDGISVGDDYVPIENAHPEQIEHMTPSNIDHEIFIIGVDIHPLPDYVDTFGTYSATMYVSIFGSVGGTVENIFAPSGGGPSE